MVPSKVVKKVVFYFLSFEAINHQFTILLIAYTSILSHVDGMAATQTLIDLHDNETEFIDNFTDVDVRGVSNAVMWSCRDGAKARSYYETVYLFAFVALIVLSIGSFVLNFCRPEFWCKRRVLIYRSLIGDSCLSIAVLLLFLSFNPSPLACQAGYSKFKYHKIEEFVDLIFKTTVVNFNKRAPIASLVFFLLWLVTNIVCFCIDWWTVDLGKNTKDTKKHGRMKMFEDKRYDSDATTEKEGDDRHYEINRVIFD